jgi:hypothetical protein
MGRSMLESGSFDPDTLTLLYQAFDETWQQIAGNYQTQAMIEDRRNQLASIIVALADNGVRDLAQIKEVATLVMKHPDEPMQLNGNRADA